MKTTIIQALPGFKGEFHTDALRKTLYATDASAYKEEPLAVAYPKDLDDLKLLLQYALDHKTSLIARTAGTSLAGQVVGQGVVVDLSKYWTAILELNVEERWVRVQPGVVRDELNLYLKAHGLFFAPETSTANRCMVGGMVGNNACGANSLVYGSTRDHLLEAEVLLSDGQVMTFKEETADTFHTHRIAQGVPGQVYETLYAYLQSAAVQQEIREAYPNPAIHRRNTGYALDALLAMEPFGGTEAFNLCKLLAGSEGTLGLATSFKLKLEPLPREEKRLLVVHLSDVAQAFPANLQALALQPDAVELMDKPILDCTAAHPGYQHLRFFLQGDPAALLCVQFSGTAALMEQKIASLQKDLQAAGRGTAFPVLEGEAMAKVWQLRKAGLGLLSNIPGDAKPVPVIEDAALPPEQLGAYVAELNSCLQKHQLSCVYYGHIATGELHLRPVINLKTQEGQRQFRAIAEDAARLVKKYRGSLSGEHGDGRLRGEFLEFMVGSSVYAILKELKEVFDPQGVFNPGKIIDSPPMDQQLRYTANKTGEEPETIFDFSESGGMLRMAEKCNGSADCRKSAVFGGTMCPSYQASKEEDKTTRARANMLREALSLAGKDKLYASKELLQVLDLCLSCKGCKSECPSNVDMAKLKAEVLQHYYDKKGIPLRTRIVGHYARMQHWASRWPDAYNRLIRSKLFLPLLQKVLHFSPKRLLPAVQKQSFQAWLKENPDALQADTSSQKGELYLFVDEFTNYTEVEIGKTAVQLLTKLGYRVFVEQSKPSGRALLSKGMLRSARKLAEANVHSYHGLVSEQRPLVGLEPSAILAFQDEYPDLLRGNLQQKAKDLASHVFVLEAFICREFEKGNIASDAFHAAERQLRFHGHCQQKALGANHWTAKMLAIPENYTVQEIKSGCCGMAGSFGYEKEHYNLSMKIGELVLFPEVRKTTADTLIAAAGTSCRQQIFDGTGRRAQHPVEILYEALRNK